MKKIITKAVMTATAFALVACGGGGYSTGGVFLTHDQLAEEFVRRVNLDVAGFDLELVKSTTLQADYIVVFDHFYGTYDAYYIGSYSPGQDLNTYLFNYQNSFYYDLIFVGGNTYQDFITGILFEKVQADSKNLAKMKALKQDIAIIKTAEAIRAQYGMSQEKALDTARFALQLKTAPAGTYNIKDYDAFAKELTGSTITEFQNDIKAGNASSLNTRLEKASDVSGMGSEGINKLIKDVFSGQN